jgi:hypothetical protein
VKTDKKPSNEPFLGTIGQNIVINNPESVVEVMSSITGDDLIQLLIQQSNLYHIQNALKWKVSHKKLKWSNITPEEMRMFLGLIILMRQLRKENTGDYWSTDPTISTPIFPHTMSRNYFESTGRSGILVTMASKHRFQGRYSKFGLCMNNLYRHLGQFTAQSRNCHLMKS